MVSEAQRVLEAASTVLVVDWPSRDVPETLARAGFTVIVRSGPGPEDYSSYQAVDREVVGGEVVGGEVVVRPAAAPVHADLVYAHRPLAELPGIAAVAQSLGATAIWVQSGVTDLGTNDPKGCWVADDQSQLARQAVESAGLTYLEEPYIADAVRRYRPWG